MPVWTKSTLRLPLQLHSALSKLAEEQGTSLNNLIIEKLNAALGGVYVSEEAANDANILERLKKVEDRLTAIERGDRN